MDRFLEFGLGWVVNNDEPELKTLLSSGYQTVGAIPTVDGEIYVAWNQIVRSKSRDFGLDMVTIPHRLTTQMWGTCTYIHPHPLYIPAKVNIPSRQVDDSMAGCKTSLVSLKS